MMQRNVELVPPNPMWQTSFQAEAEQIAVIFSDNAVAIEHIGSTAIPNIKAKPIVDILIGVEVLEKVDAHNEAMIQLGYEPRGEFGIPGRRYFSKHVQTAQSYHVHVFQSGDPQVARHLDFRDYMLAHPQDAQAYSDLKEILAQKFSHDVSGYTDAKSDFITDIDQKAAIWKKHV